MSAKIISERKTVTEKIPTLVFRLKKTGDVCASYGCDNNGNPVFEKEYKDITAQLEKLGVENPANFFEHPSNYCGLAAVKSKRLAQKYRELMK